MFGGKSGCWRPVSQLTRGQRWEERWRRRGRKCGWKLGLSRKVMLGYSIGRGDSVRSRDVMLAEDMLIGLRVSARIVVDVQIERVRSESQLML